MSWTRRAQPFAVENAEVFERGIQFAGYANGGRCGVEIVAGFNYNGSGPEAFGGVDEWPHVEVSVSLPVGRFDLREELVERMKQLVDSFIEEYKLQ